MSDTELWILDPNNNPNPMADRTRWLRILRELDVQTMLDFHRTYTPDLAIASDPDAILCGLHKARVSCKDLTEAERAESAEWLARNSER
jgi:hypothetical protein